ncbi:MAG TPA: hypothetical protein VHQ41_01515 [Patescibacteria group bacterium]|jgi:hypothetical protein|nr:hypothetical protein [Patescibacteria group bacterium]
MKSIQTRKDGTQSTVVEEVAKPRNINGVEDSQVPRHLERTLDCINWNFAGHHLSQRFFVKKLEPFQRWFKSYPWYVKSLQTFLDGRDGYIIIDFEATAGALPDSKFTTQLMRLIKALNSTKAFTGVSTIDGVALFLNFSTQDGEPNLISALTKNMIAVSTLTGINDFNFAIQWAKISQVKQVKPEGSKYWVDTGADLLRKAVVRWERRLAIV